MNKTFTVNAADGAVYRIPIQKVIDDYAEFLVEADGVSAEEVMSLAMGEQEKDPYFWRQWWGDYCSDWDTVTSWGEEITPPDHAQLVRILRFYRTNYNNSPDIAAEPQ